MEALQAERLLRLVNHVRGTYLIPNGVELANLFSPPGEKMTARGAREVIRRLAKHRCIRGKGLKRYINTRLVVTQMPSCLYLLFFHELCLHNDRTVSKRAFHQQVKQKHGTKFLKLGVSIEKIYRYAVLADYIRPVKTERVMLEIGGTLTFFIPYLKLFRKHSKP